MVKKLADQMYRLRQGSYRVIYEIDDQDQAIMVLAIKP